MGDNRKIYFDENTLGKLISGELSSADEERIRNWLADPDDEEMKFDILERAFDKAVQPAQTTGDNARRMLADFEMRNGMAATISPAAKPQAPAKPRSKSPWRSVGRVAAVLLPLVALTGALVYFMGNNPEEFPSRVATTIEAGGQSREIILPCGTKIIINKEAVVSWHEETYPEQREVVLSGEAYFMVAKKDGAPFTVVTDDLHISVLGTVFNVNATENAGETVVSLYEGAVNVECGDGHNILAPQEEFALDSATGTAVIREVTGSMPAWLTTTNIMSLGEIVEALASHYGMEIMVGAGIDTAQSYIFTFDRKAGINRLLDLIAEVHGKMEYEITDNIVHIKSIR